MDDLPSDGERNCAQAGLACGVLQTKCPALLRGNWDCNDRAIYERKTPDRTFWHSRSNSRSHSRSRGQGPALAPALALAKGGITNWLRTHSNTEIKVPERRCGQGLHQAAEPAPRRNPTWPNARCRSASMHMYALLFMRSGQVRVCVVSTYYCLP